MTCNTIKKEDTGMEQYLFIECGCCGEFHPTDFYGDCRDDLNRLHIEDIEGYEDNTLWLDEQEGWGGY
jgi:hypothetical protein